MLLKLTQDDIRTTILCRVGLLYFVVMLSYGTFKGLPDEKETLPLSPSHIFTWKCNING